MRIMGFQISVEEYTDDLREVINEEQALLQIIKSLNLIEDYNVDIAVFPEMCYLEST